MKIEVRVKAGAKVPGIEKQADGTFAVKVKEPASEGRANEAVARALAEFFKVPPGRVTLVHGGKSRVKLFEIRQV